MRAHAGPMRAHAGPPVGVSFLDPWPPTASSAFTFDSKNLVQVIPHVKQSVLYVGGNVNATETSESAGTEGKYIGHQTVAKNLTRSPCRTVTVVMSRFVRYIGSSRMAG